ncbi:hypothetical protein F383_00438 [Gossypium arboreum]|uniref:Uncharacterized protein n=1 Tax=Gossypium arboreum TaxID=29729 RepID=A0A0B0PH86_GOSAR|nr:hypothetical protein F383_00438 [Gossypium arboreum]
MVNGIPIEIFEKFSGTVIRHENGNV